MPPKTAKSYVIEAQQLEKTGDIPGAIKLYKRFLSRHRDHPNALKARSRTALLCLMVGKYDDAIAIVENAGAAGHSHLHMMYTLAQACAYAGYLDKAHDALDKTLAIEPDHPPAIARLATVLQYEGRKDEALKLLDDANQRGVDSWDLDHTLGELAPKAGRVDEAVDRIQKRLNDPAIKDDPRIELEYMLSTLLEKQQDYAGAWEAAKRGNELVTNAGFGRHAIKGAVKNKINTGIEDYVTRINTIMDIFNPEMLKSLEPDDSGPNPLPQMLMISGMPRSGTTLLEQILSAHPQAESAGEAPFLIKAAADLKLYPKPSSDFIKRLSIKKRSKIGTQILQDLYLRSGGDQFVVDKHPGNDEHIGFLSAIAPGAKMILTRRDPRDIALSCFFRNFAHGHGWANKFESIVSMIEIRLQMHEHWLELIPQAAPWIEIRVGDYEKIVRDPETQTREIVKFAGLPWDDSCLNFSKRKRIVPTLQPHQAAQGIYTGSLAKWAPYAECMGDQLERLNAICKRFGYLV